MDDALKNLPRLTEEALGPCIRCNSLMLEVGAPLFKRLKMRRCGIDGTEVRKHVGLAMHMGGGATGLALASVLGPKVEPVVVLDDWPEVNVCIDCAGRMTVEELSHLLMEHQS